MHGAEDDRVERSAQVLLRARIINNDTRRPRLLFADDAHNFFAARMRGREAIRPLARQQVVEQSAERIDVTRRRERLSPRLLRRCRTRREMLPPGRGHIELAVVTFEQLCDAEVEQLRLT